MDIKSTIKELGLESHKCSNISILSSKHGNMVYKLKYSGKHYVLKCFTNENSREIKLYDLLNSLNIPTIKVIASCDSGILLEDIVRSKDKQMATEKDFQNKEVIISLAKWYREFHDKGKKYIKENGIRPYFVDELSYITRESMDLLTSTYKLLGAPGWNLVLNRYEELINYTKKMEQTFNYNDFSYLNMVISKDSILMLDFHLMGYGVAYCDIRNILMAIGENSKHIFLEHYGPYVDEERILDDPLSILIALCMSLKFSITPLWAKLLIETIFCGQFIYKFKKALDIVIKNTNRL